jgi:hypothetical protein
MKTAAKVFGTAGLAAALFVAGGIGLFQRVPRPPAPAPRVATPAL